MHKIRQNRVAKMERPQEATRLNRLSWDDLRIFVACAEETSFRKVSLKLGYSTSTISRRIERLEDALGLRLFHRLLEGISLTQEGQTILSSAKAMEESLYDVLRNRNTVDQTSKGHVSISITEGLGSYWLMPRLVEFQREHPFLIMSVSCAMHSADVLRMEADLAIHYQKPEAPDVIAVKLGRMHIYPFASEEYTRVYGVPRSIEDMRSHRLVDQFAPTIVDGAWAKLLDFDTIEEITGIRTNASTALFYAIEKGAGIGGLPTYATALGARVIPIDIGVRNHLDIWLTFHPDARKIKRNLIVIDWLKKIFDPAVYPWFRDEFIHPNELMSICPKSAEINVIDGYFAARPC